MKRESARRRNEAFSDREVLNNARKTAITLAWRLAYDGKPFPIHIDLQLFSGVYSRTERFTLMDAAFMSRMDSEDELVGSFGAIAIRRARPASVPADVIHRVRLR